MFIFSAAPMVSMLYCVIVIISEVMNRVNIQLTLAFGFQFNNLVLTEKFTKPDTNKPSAACNGVGGYRLQLKTTS